MSERTIGTTIGGIIAIIGAIIGFFAYMALGAFSLSTIFAPAGGIAVVFLILCIIAIVLALMLLFGYMIKWSAIILLIIGIITIIVAVMVAGVSMIPLIAALLVIIGAILGLAMGAMKK